MPKSEPRYFFKVFFPDQSSNSLRIPPAFWEHIEAESGEKVALKGQSGSIWKVKLVKNSGGFILDDGWKEFVADHSLVMGDFLIFRYNGNLRFEVLVFDSTACEKKKAFLVRPSVEEEIDVVEESVESQEEVRMKEEEEEEENKPLVHFKKRRFDGSLKMKRGINDPLAIKVRSKKKKKHSQSDIDELNLKRSKSSSSSRKDLIIPKQEYESYSPSNPRKSSRDMPMQKNEKSMHRNSEFSVRCYTINKEIKLRYQSGQVSRCIPHSSEKSTSKKSSKPLEVEKSDDMACQRGSAFRMRSLISQRRPVTPEEVERTLQRARSFKSDNPFTIAIMKNSYVYTSLFMCIPSWFARKHLPKENTVVTVWDPTDKPWKMTYISYNTRGALSGGWGKFSYAHNLEKYDVCVFELIKTDHLKVHIYRVVEEIKPYIGRGRSGQN